MKLEQLLNELIQRGWKPRGLKHKIFSVQKTPDNMVYFDGGFGLERCYDFRQLTSKESGLWQFVCENGIIENGKKVHDYVIKQITYSDENHCGGYGMCNAEYYMMMGALKDEKDLEKFLLENIKIS